jgi:hypothetical protein
MYELQLQGAAKTYHKDMAERGVTEALRLPEVEVFAFQEMDRRTGAPRNQAHIFNSLTGLMKAQSYEMTSAPQRQKSPAVYQFNLLNVVDAPLIRLYFEKKKVRAVPITSEHYIARYIIRKQTTFSRIRFIQADDFKRCLGDYEHLHEANCKWFPARLKAFYQAAPQDDARIALFRDEFRRAVGYHLKWRIKQERGEEFEPQELGFEWPSFSDKPTVTLDVSAATLQWLNKDTTSQNRATKALKDVYRYEGPFRFDSPEIPF